MKKLILNQKKMVTLMSVIICIVIVLFSACAKKEKELIVNGDSYAPKLPATPYTYQGVSSGIGTLGRVLFYDKNLSLNNAISCGSCHIQAHGFADNRQFSVGLNNGYTARNTSSLVSSQGHKHFWDGRAGNYDTAVFMPVMNHVEMDMFNLDILPSKLSNLSYYSPLFINAYGTPEINVSRIRNALAEFVNSLYSYKSRFDNFNPWNGGTGDLNAFEIAGWNIFNGKGKCMNCHNGNNLDGAYSSTFEDIGLDVNYADKGRGNITHNTADYGKFNVPTLRNIALTAPYMHDGRYTTLRQVIDHYSEGIQDSPNLSWHFRNIPASFFTPDSLGFIPFQSPQPPAIISSFPVQPLNLTEQEKYNLEAFLKTLTDVSFIADPRYSNPF